MTAERSILTIEDDKDIQNLIREVFKIPEFQDYQFHFAQTTQEARAIISQHGIPTLILLNLRLSDDSEEWGLRFLEKRGSDLVGVPIMIITADSSPETVERCKKGGASAILFKPFDDIDILIEKVKNTVK